MHLAPRNIHVLNLDVPAADIVDDDYNPLGVCHHRVSVDVVSTEIMMK